MKTLQTRLAPAAIAIACLLLAPVAGAETVVPPENSAATQYTEAIPTGGGQKDAGKTGGGKEATPAEVLGAGKAKKLKAHGDEGRAAAEVAAETAPRIDSKTVTPSPAPQSTSSKEPAPSDGGKGGGRGEQPQANVDETSLGKATAIAEPPAGDPLATESGSSGVGEVLGQATGASASGQLGPLLPLLILGTICWSLLFAWRQRRQAE